MKRILFLVFALMATTAMFAAEESNDKTVEANYLWRHRGNIYAGKTFMVEAAYVNLLKNTCPQAYNQYLKGEKLIRAGWGVFGAGAAVMAICWIPLCLENPYSPINEVDEYSRFMSIQYQSSQVAAILGGLAVASSIPIICVGYTTRDKSMNTYNLQCVDNEPAITYNITAGQNGLGLAINF